jgi:radical SAM protein (TIGR01212 family)
MKNRFYSFNTYLREIFKERVHRISLNAGFGCPNLDGYLSSSGCIYCNNRAFAVYAHSNSSIEEQIEKSINFYSEKLVIKKFIAYFQAFTNTYADTDTLREKYDVIKKFPQIVGLFISTRPDFIDEEKIKLISSYKDNYLVWVEYGLQTTHNHILKIINRNHTYEDFIKALDLTRKYGINVGVHIIAGLLDETYEEVMEDARRLGLLDIQGVKFHILHVLKDTLLEKRYSEGKVNLLSQDEYTKIICDFLERLPSSVVLLRLVSTASMDYLVAPLWINNREEVILSIKKELEKRGTYQGYLYESACRKGQ